MAGLVLGALTAFGQGQLPDSFRSVANSAGSWSLVAFLLALLGRTQLRAAIIGALSLWALLAGYVGYNLAVDVPSASSTVLFWVAAGLVAGPILGTAAFFVRTGTELRSVIGTAVISGVLIGEGVYGLTVIADTTSPVYWQVQIMVGVVLAGVVGRQRRWSGRDAVLAILLIAVVAVVFRFGYALVGA